MLVAGFETLGEKGFENPDWEAILEQEYVFKNVTISCTKHELGKLIQFLEEAREQYRGVDGYGHLHFRDWDREWTDKESDLVISFNLDSLKQ